MKKILAVLLIAVLVIVVGFWSPMDIPIGD